MLSFSLVAEALTGLIYNRPSCENSKFFPLPDGRKTKTKRKEDEDEDEEAQTTRREEDSDVDFEASRRSTIVQSKSTIRSALFLAKH